IGSCRGAQPHDGTCSSAVRPYCLRSKTWESLRPYVHLCNNADRQASRWALEARARRRHDRQRPAPPRAVPAVFSCQPCQS
ncbi:MAG: hypothetical protein VB125_01195, partial [Burkholderia sp.]